MAVDDPFLNIDGSVESPPEQEGGKIDPTQAISPPSKYQIMERTLWVKTVFTISPSGIMFINKQKSYSWFDKDQRIVKKKVKKKLEVKSAKIGKEEVY